MFFKSFAAIISLSHSKSVNHLYYFILYRTIPVLFSHLLMMPHIFAYHISNETIHRFYINGNMNI